MIKIDELTLREKICQTVIINEPEKLFEQYGGYKAFFEKYPVGGIYMGGSAVGGNMPGTDEYFDVQDDWDEELKVPIIYCADSANESPKIYQMALGATKDRELAYKRGKIEGRVCAKNGLHWTFMPVADLAMSYLAPINIRSMGDDVKEICDMVGNIVEGMTSEHTIATAKHFPGKGREMTDSHLARLEVGLTKEEWDSTYRVIYKELIDRGLMSVMSAHLALPSYQKERDEYGAAPVATFSKELVTDLLKDDLGFKGIVVTDALTMGGAGGGSVEADLKAFEAGNDMLLWPTMEYVDVLEEKILNGEIPMERLDDAVERILRVKEFAFNRGKITIEQEEIDEVEREIAEKSITLLNNYKNLLPVNPETVKKMLIVYIAKNEQMLKKLKLLKPIFESYGIEVVERDQLWIPELKELEKDVDLTLFACFEGPSAIPGPICINGENGASVWASQASDVSKSVVASFGSPFLYHQYYKYYPTYVNAYSPNEISLKAFAKALFGEIG